MKMEVIRQNGRKKDLWDVHELMEHLSLEQMMKLHAERYPHSHTQKELKENSLIFNMLILILTRNV